MEKIIQIVATPDTEEKLPTVVVLTNSGRIWRGIVTDTNEPKMIWQELQLPPGVEYYLI